MKLSKRQLDSLATILGIIAGVSGVLVEFEVIPQKIGGAIGGIATIALGYIVQRPADAHPTTEEVEDLEASSDP
jgi:hypothetical protein